MEENGDFNNFLEGLKGDEKNPAKQKTTASHKRFVNCEICGKKVKNNPETISSHTAYCKKKKEKEKTVSAPAISSKTVILPAPEVKPDDKKPIKHTPVKKNIISPQGQNKAGFIDNLDLPLIIIGAGIIAAGLFFVSLVNPRRDSPAKIDTDAMAKTVTEAPITPQESTQPAPAIITPPTPPMPIYAVR